ncbi:MAG: glycosyl hydrolase [Candidatus Omnitrophota bacterium]
MLIIGQQQDTLEAYINDIGLVPGGFMAYTSIQQMDGLDLPADHGAGINDARYEADRYPHAVIQLALYMVGALDGVIGGKYDANIAALAKWLKSVKRPVYFRIGYEFDLPDNAYDPKKYQQAYRYIVDRLRAHSVSNVAYVWHSAAMIQQAGPYLDWYPGDDYVDWVAVSIFNPMQIKPSKDLVAFARQHRKAFMIAESSPAGLVSTGAKKEWFRHYFDFIQESDIKIVCYINSFWDTYPMFKALHWGDARVQADPAIKAMWLRETKTYLRSYPGLFNRLSGP